ncbi:MAG: acyl-CoA synthetase [Myxococcota bacterium]
MPNLIDFARTAPDRPALIYGNGESVETYAQLEQRSRQVAHMLRGFGLVEGDGVAVLVGNEDEFFDLYWGAQRVGLYFTAVNWHLAEAEVRYIVENCDAKVLFASARMEKLAVAGGKATNLEQRISLHGEIEGFTRYEDAVGAAPEDPPLDHQRGGSVMLYSSGTTGQPKGVRRPLPGRDFDDPILGLAAAGFGGMFGFREGDRYICPAPLYHAAPLAFSANQHFLGSTVVVMRRFDPEQALQIIQNQKVTISQWVPTHFKRMLELPPERRKRYDVSSLRVAVHAAAPCPVPVKRAMIDWWGPILWEYYAGTEGGGTIIDSEQWLAHPGSVGRPWPGAQVMLFDERGQPIDEPRREGAIYFAAAAEPLARFEYHKDEEKTRSSYRGDWFTLGDVGFLDEEGYLFLTDRQSNMIISGGVNIYPQETENCLMAHERVHDVAVIGVPSDSMGEEVKAVVIPATGARPGPELESELIEYSRTQIAHYKCPRSIDFADELPRTETGKLQKRKIKQRYWEGRDSLI